MAGRPSPQNPSISRLTSPPETIPSCCPENAPSQFQPHSGRHLGPDGWVTVLCRLGGPVDVVARELCNGRASELHRGSANRVLDDDGALPTLRGQPEDRIQVAGTLSFGGGCGVGGALARGAGTWARDAAEHRRCDCGAATGTAELGTAQDREQARGLPRGC